MRSGHCFLTACLIATSIATSALAQTNSGLESSIPPAKLQELRASRETAQEELRASGVDILSPQILHAFLEPGASIAITRMEQVAADGSKFTLTVAVEKILRGVPPAKFSAEVYWSERPWPLRPPQGAQRIRPVTGKRILASLSTQSTPTSFLGILDLDNPSEAAFLPPAVAAAKMDADASTSGSPVYENGLASESPVVRDLAMQRLLGAKDCSGGSHCEESILAETRRLLASANPNDRMEAVRWLGDLAHQIQSCESHPCGPPVFHREPIRELMQTAVEDKNVAVGDLAFQYLATLDFDKKENAGYSEEIVPALRMVDKYAFGTEHWIGGSLNAVSTCMGPAPK